MSLPTKPFVHTGRMPVGPGVVMLGPEGHLADARPERYLVLDGRAWPTGGGQSAVSTADLLVALSALEEQQADLQEERDGLYEKLAAVELALDQRDKTEALVWDLLKQADDPLAAQLRRSLS